MSNYISIGKFVAVHGLKGELILKHALGKKTSLKGVQALFIEESKSTYIPWFIQQTKPRSQMEVLIKLEGVDTPESAKKFNQKTIWLTREDFEKQASKSAPISFIGFTVVEDDKILGTITEVIEQPHQVLCTIYVDGKEVLIPLHQETLQQVDRIKKVIYVTLPEGLIKLYLG